MYSLDELLPHKDRMRLLDEIVDIDESRAISKATVNDQWPLSTDHTVNPIICIELIAQTIAAWDISNKGYPEDGIGLGVLVSVKSAIFHVPDIEIGTPLSITIHNINNIDFFGTFRGTVMRGDDKIAEAVLQVYRITDPDEMAALDNQ